MSKGHSRPLSPHLEIYRWQWSSTYSILHRLTGIFLSLNTLLIALWLLGVVFYPQAIDTILPYWGSWIGRLYLIGWSFAIFYHLSNGVRHLLWDTGRLLELKAARWSGHGVMAASLLLTALLWGIVGL